MRLESQDLPSFCYYYIYLPPRVAPSYRPRLTAGRAARVIVPSPSLALFARRHQPSPPSSTSSLLSYRRFSLLLFLCLPIRVRRLNVQTAAAPISTFTFATCAFHPVCNGSLLPNSAVILPHATTYGQTA